MNTMLLRTPRFSLPLPDSLGAAMQEMDRRFQQAFGEAAGASQASIAAWEDAGCWYFEADMPGVTADTLEIEVLNGQLRIAYERKAPELQDCRILHNARQYGPFEGRFALPEQVDHDSIQAQLKDGVLRVTLSKRPEAQPKRIEVKTG
jgi:HSP20 family protein